MPEQNHPFEQQAVRAQARTGAGKLIEFAQAAARTPSSNGGGRNKPGFSEFLDRKPEVWHSEPIAGRKAPHALTESGRSRLAWRNRRDKLKGRGREIIAGMKGWRPSACP